MDLLTSLSLGAGSKGFNKGLLKIAGVGDKYKELVSSSRDNYPSPVGPEDNGLVITKWKALAPVKKGICVALYHMANPRSYSTIDFSALADKNEFIVMDQWQLKDKFGAAEVVISALKKAGISCEKRPGR